MSKIKKESKGVNSMNSAPITLEMQVPFYIRLHKPYTRRADPQHICVVQGEYIGSLLITKLSQGKDECVKFEGFKLPSCNNNDIYSVTGEVRSVTEHNYFHVMLKFSWKMKNLLIHW